MEKICKYCEKEKPTGHHCSGRDAYNFGRLCTIKEIRKIIKNINLQIPEFDGEPVDISASDFKKELNLELNKLEEKWMKKQD